MEKEYRRLFTEDTTMYAIMEDNTLQKYDGENWIPVPSLEIRCPSCGKLLEPHVCSNP